MDNSIYITLSRELALLRDMDSTSNNIANLNTTGYNASRVMFNQYLMPAGGQNKLAFAQDAATYRDTSYGSTHATGNPLDVAISGEGYFVVDSPQGRRYTRAGNFQLDNNGSIVTAEGYPVLDITGQKIQLSQTDKAITIGSAGNLTANGEERGQISVVTFANPQALQRRGERMYSTDQLPQPSDNPRVVQGALENANTQPVVEMTHMINVTRSFGETAKFIQIMYDLQTKHINTWTQQSNG